MKQINHFGINKSKKHSGFRHLKVVAFIWLLATSFWSHAQFISRGMASLANIPPNAKMQPITLLPDGNTPTSGYGIGNISTVFGTSGYGYIGIVKGDLATGLAWDKLYIADRTIETVKSLIFEKELYVLFNVLDEENNISYSGIFAVDQSNGSITKVQCFGKADDYFFKAKDFTVCDGRLIVVGQKYFSFWANDYAAQILVVDPVGLTVLASTAVLYNNEGYLNPTQVVSIKDQFVVSFMAREGYISFDDQVVVAKFGYDNTTNGFNIYAEAGYACPKILSHVNLAYNSYNNTIPLLFQEFANIDGAGTLNLFILDPTSLNPVFTNSYMFPRRMYKSNISVDGQYLSISAANNTADNPTPLYGSAQSLFDHSGDFISSVTNPYQRIAGLSVGWDVQVNYLEGSTSLFAIENNGFLNWIYGYGPDKECDLNEVELKKFDNFILRTKGVKTKYNSYENIDFVIMERKAGFYGKVECGERIIRKAEATTGVVTEKGDEIYKLVQNNESITLLSESVIGNFSLMDGYGKTIKSGTAASKRLVFDTQELSQGIYILKVEIEKQWYIRKIIN